MEKPVGEVYGVNPVFFEGSDCIFSWIGVVRAVAARAVILPSPWNI
jgi:hypothetical protein